MSKLVIASFADESKAIEATHKLTELENFGDITINELVVLRKKESGEIEVVKSEDNVSGLPTLTGLALGSLIGALGGPVGLLAGMFTGTFAGSLIELDNYGFADDFVDKVSEKIPSGSIAIAAEIEEDSNIFIDDALLPLGASITRLDFDYAYANYEDEQIDEFDEELSDLRHELKTANEENKAKIKAKIADLKAKRKAKVAEIETKVKANNAELKNKTQQDSAEFKSLVKAAKTQKLQDKIYRKEGDIENLEAELQDVKADLKVDEGENKLNDKYREAKIKRLHEKIEKKGAKVRSLKQKLSEL